MTHTGTTSAVPDDSGAADYQQLLLDAPGSGRCPVMLGSDGLAGVGGLDRPPDVSAAIDPIDPIAVLSRWWPGPACRPGCPCGEQMPDEMPQDPLGSSFPDLSRDPTTVAVAARALGAATPTMVDANRPADVPAAVGWSGIGNYQGYQDLPRICAVLRRWEQRYGAVLVGLTRSRLFLEVAHPPRTEDECRRVAAEHFAFCPDQQDPQNGDWYTLARYAGMMRGAGRWTFWWD